MNVLFTIHMQLEFFNKHLQIILRSCQSLDKEDVQKASMYGQEMKQSVPVLELKHSRSSLSSILRLKLFFSYV